MKTIQYLNFEPSEWIAEFGRQKFETIWEKAPSDSFIAARAEKISENQFRGALEVRACDLQFLVEAFADNAIECIEQLTSQAMEHIRVWRQQRVDSLQMAS